MDILCIVLHNKPAGGDRFFGEWLKAIYINGLAVEDLIPSLLIHS
jgi:hypothetical protein